MNLLKVAQENSNDVRKCISQLHQVVRNASGKLDLEWRSKLYCKDYEMNLIPLR